MIIQKEKCGCYVARYKGREAHSYTFAKAIMRMLEEIEKEKTQSLPLKELNLEDIPF